MIVSGQNIFSIIVIGALMLLVYKYVNLVKQNNELKEDLDGIQMSINANIIKTENLKGQVQAEAKTVILSQETANSFLRADMERLRRDFKFKVNSPKDYTEVNTATSIPIAIQGRDTLIIERMIEKPSKAYPMKGRYVGTLFAIGDSLIGKISFNDTVRVVVSKAKRENWWQFWKKKPLKTDVFLSNPDGTVTNLKSIRTE